MPAPPNNSLRTAGRIAIAIGGVGSVALTLEAGHRNPSAFLMAMFAGWVLLPFLVLGYADRLSRTWTRSAGVRLSVLMFFESTVSLAVYGFMAFGATTVKLAAPFLLLPPVLIALVAIVSIGPHRARSI
jgi:hypothetical protein